MTIWKHRSNVTFKDQDLIYCIFRTHQLKCFSNIIYSNNVTKCFKKWNHTILKLCKKGIRFNVDASKIRERIGILVIFAEMLWQNIDLNIKRVGDCRLVVDMPTIIKESTRNTFMEHAFRKVISVKIQALDIKTDSSRLNITEGITR